MVLSVATAVSGAVLLGVGLVGYLFRPVAAVKRILFVVSAVALLIPFHTGAYRELTWAINGVGLALAAILVSVEWLARASRLKGLVPATTRTDGEIL